MRAELEDVKKLFGGKLIGKVSMQKLVCETLIFFPTELIDKVTQSCWFITSYDDAWGFTLRGDELGGKHLIFLSDELFDQDKTQQHYTVAHEIGHVVLGHRNAILEPQSKTETAKQEAEADQFAQKYLPY